MLTAISNVTFRIYESTCLGLIATIYHKSEFCHFVTIGVIASYPETYIIPPYSSLLPSFHQLKK